MALLRAALIVFLFQLFSPIARAADAVPTGGTLPRYVALTFDDGPSGAQTDYLLNGLRARGVRATFFLCGYRMEKYPGLVGQIAEDGHELAVHGFTHRYLHTMAEEEITQELADTAAMITELAGVQARVFRPPGGLYSEEVLTAAEDAGMSVVLWNIDTYDWRDKNAGTIAQRIVSQIHSGDVVLLHDLNRASADGALQAIDALQRSGWEFVTISELALLTGQELTPGQIFELPPR